MVSIVLAGSFRLFSLLYAMRVENVTGIFVIIICKMTKIVFQFSGIYLLQIAVFSGMFMLVVTDPACPGGNIFPFDTIYDNLVSLFSLTLGNNQLPPITTTQLALMYVIYMLLTNVVMLSILTGISGSISDRVISRRLKNILPIVEHLEDAISAETILLMLVYPFRKQVQSWRMGKASDPYLITRQGNDPNVSIETIRLPVI